MKSKKIQFLETILRWMAIVVIKKYNPKIIGITGSVGKTSTKEAVYLVLSAKFRVRKNEKNYNNEIGIPLTIIGAETGGRSLWKWAKVFLKWLGVVIFPFTYPELLVLEMGVDKPKDMKYLMSFIPVSIGIVTNISSSHLEFFKTIDNIAKEKGRIIESLGESGVAILNADDERVLSMQSRTGAKIITYGIENNADVKASGINYSYVGSKLDGISFKLNYENKTIPIRLKHVLGKHQVASVLAAAATGIIFKINLVDISKSLENYHSPQGRMNLIEGINGSHLIDDTYNASPISVLAALDVLADLQATRKIAVLGDMLELGDETRLGHEKVVEKVFEIKADMFLGVGERMEMAVEKLAKLGYSTENIFFFDDPALAGRKLKEILQEGDLVVVKGSQSMRMECVVKMLMKNQEEAKNILCRQSSDWLKKPFKKP